MIADCHVHSSFSPDADPSVRQIADKLFSPESPVFAAAVTDHFDIHETADEWRFFPEEQIREVERCREGAPEGKKLLRGIELGQATHSKALANFLVSYPFDIVMGSMHNMRGKEDFYYIANGINLSPHELSALLREYYTEILELLEWGKFDSLSHLWYSVRYLPPTAGILNCEKDLLKRIVAEVVRSGRALELNGSAFADGREDQIELEYGLFELYRSAGGRLVTLGSDAHTISELASGLDGAVKCLKSLGFTEACYFENRKPVLYGI